MAKYRKIKRHKHSYRIRKRRRYLAMRALLITVIILLLMAAGFFAYRGIVRYTDENENVLPAQSSEVSASLPQETSEESSLPESDDPSSNLQESSGEATSASPTAVRAITLSCYSLEQLKQQLTAIDPAQYNTVLLTVKDSGGQILYTTASSHAKNCGAVSATAFDLTEAVAAIKEAGFIPLAKMYTLKDHLAAHASFNNSYVYNNQREVTWFDNAADLGGKPWLNPYQQNAVDYLCSLTEEVAAAGFRGIVLYGSQFPDTADRYGITYDDNGVSLQDAIASLNKQLSLAAAESGVPVIHAYWGSCYQEEVNTHIYGCSPNEFSGTPVVPILGNDLSLLQYVSADRQALIPSVSSYQLTEELRALGIEQYIVE